MPMLDVIAGFSSYVTNASAPAIGSGNDALRANRARREYAVSTYGVRKHLFNYAWKDASNFSKK
jgi:hypothetical protein